MKATTVPSAPSAKDLRSRPGHRRLWWGLSALVLVAVAVGAWMSTSNGRSIWGSPSKNSSEPSASKSSPVVETEYPRKGGTDRICVLPGSVEPFESADLYAKVSGFLLETADIGKAVEKGDPLARISVPEYEKQVKKDAASVQHSKAQLRQMEARLAAAKAESKAAEQMIIQAKVDVKSKTAFRSYRSKQLERIKLLYKDNAVEAKLVDEETDRYEAAFEAENAAKEAVATTELKFEAAKAKVAQGEADIDDAKAEIEVAKAELERSKVLLGYTSITSPYSGVVTKRNFSRGEFIRSADAGGDRVPVVAVDRIDLMRVVVQVPDSDVPFVDVGDRATVEIGALKGPPIEALIARKANSEDAQTRTMRTEIDLPNPDGKLLRNMYGRVTITLQAGSPTAFRVASAAAIDRVGTAAKVRVVRDRRVHFVPVEIGNDNGTEVEIIKGLHESDQVVVRVNGPVEEGTEVTITNPTR